MSTQCFRCDGSGEIRNACGETEVVCRCEDGFEDGDCPDCNGSGK